MVLESIRCRRGSNAGRQRDQTKWRNDHTDRHSGHCKVRSSLIGGLISSTFPAISPNAPLSSVPLSLLMRTCVTPCLPFPSSSFKTIIKEMIKIGLFIDLSPFPNAPSFELLTCFLGNTANLSVLLACTPTICSLPSWSTDSQGEGEGCPAGYWGGAGSAWRLSAGGWAHPLPGPAEHPYQYLRDKSTGKDWDGLRPQAVTLRSLRRDMNLYEQQDADPWALRSQLPALRAVTLDHQGD